MAGRLEERYPGSDLGWAQFPKGTVVGQQRTYRGHARGRPDVILTMCCTVSDDGFDPQWSGPDGFSIKIEGERRMDATLRLEPRKTPDISDKSDVMSVYKVGTAVTVHAIPFVCRGDPGVITATDLPSHGTRRSVV